MEAQYYSEKSIAVFGDTKPWANNLRSLGGKFNSNLKGRPGWIFPKTKENEVIDLVSRANQGLIQPSVAGTTTQVNYPLTLTGVPANYPPPLTGLNIKPVSPNRAMATLINQPEVPIIPRPTVAPMIPKPIVAPVSPQPVTVLPAKPVTVSFNNMFIAADGLTYQIVMYTVPVPSIGQKVLVTVEDFTADYVVSSIESKGSIVDDILITEENTEQEPSVSRAIIMNGQWKIHCLQDEHTVTFQ